MSGDGDLELDDLAARALASILLERTADTIKDEGSSAALGLVQLADDTSLSLEVCAAVLMATSWLAGAGGLTADEVFAASLAMEPDDDQVPVLGDYVVEVDVELPFDDAGGVAVPDDVADMVDGADSTLYLAEDPAADVVDWQSMIPDAIKNGGET